MTTPSMTARKTNGEAYLIDAVRTPIGRHGGALASVRPDDLAAVALEALMGRVGLPKGDVGDVILGCANQAGEDNRNVARMSALLAGFPVTVPGVTVNRLCASGLEAVTQAARELFGSQGERDMAATKNAVPAARLVSASILGTMRSLKKSISRSSVWSPCSSAWSIWRISWGLRSACVVRLSASMRQ